MTTYFVSRHPGAAAWAERQGIKAEGVAHLDPGQIKAGDVVIGTLPVHLVAEICALGGRYFHLTLDLPEESRGIPLSADDMDLYGARIEEYKARKVE